MAGRLTEPITHSVSVFHSSSITASTQLHPSPCLFLPKSPPPIEPLFVSLLHPPRRAAGGCFTTAVTELKAVRAGRRDRNHDSVADHFVTTRFGLVSDWWYASSVKYDSQFEALLRFNMGQKLTCCFASHQSRG